MAGRRPVREKLPANSSIALVIERARGPAAANQATRLPDAEYIQSRLSDNLGRDRRPAIPRSNLPPGCAGAPITMIPEQRSRCGNPGARMLDSA
jgi:hypothetical protein